MRCPRQDPSVHSKPETAETPEVRSATGWRPTECRAGSAETRRRARSADLNPFSGGIVNAFFRHHLRLQRIIMDGEQEEMLFPVQLEITSNSFFAVQKRTLDASLMRMRHT